MKKTICGFLVTIIAITALSGCNLLAKANGIILYGEEQDIVAAIDKEKDELVKEEQHQIKILENGDKKIMILMDETAQALLDKKLIREITNQEKGKSKAISSLPKVTKGEGLLFAKEEKNDIIAEGIDMKINYEGNLIIGEGRTYADMFLIVDEEDFALFQGTDKMMAILEYDKDPSADGISYDVEKAQLVRIEE